MIKLEEVKTQIKNLECELMEIINRDSLFN